MKIKNEGVCRSCLKRFSGSGMGRHLLSCKAKKQEDQKEKARTSIYHIRVWGYQPFWLHIEMPAKATLADLDVFLRRTWLECCGHLSEFTINGIRYSAPFEDDWGMDSESTEVPLSRVLKVKDKFEYVYDFGSSTYLEGQVVAERKGTLRKKVKILARNHLPDIPCDGCGEKATQICTECMEAFCDACLEEHECGEEMALPIVNSPRTGVCGYTGDQDSDNFVAPGTKD